MAGPIALAPRAGENISDVELEQAGFTREEIDRLRGLREMYPFIEYVDSRRQWERLSFVKWLYMQGQIKK